MAGKEEKKGSMESSKWMLTPCTAAKSEKDAVAGDEGPEMQFPTKRKAVAGSGYKEGDRPPEGWIDVYKLSDPASVEPFSSHSREAAIDKILKDAVLPAAAVKQAPAAAPPTGAEAKPKRRLTKGEIMSIIALKPEPVPSADYLDELAEYDPPESIAERRRQHEEDVAYFGDMDEKYEEFRQQVITGLKKDGYYEVDADYLARKDKPSKPAWKPFDFLDPEELASLAATPEQEQRWLDQGAIRRYVPDQEDALLISYGEDHESVGDEDDSVDDASDDEEEDAGAQGHKGAPTIVEAN